MYKILKNKLSALFPKRDRSASVEVVPKPKIKTPRKASLDLASKAKVSQEKTTKKQYSSFVAHQMLTKQATQKRSKHLPQIQAIFIVQEGQKHVSVNVQTNNPQKSEIRQANQYQSPNISKDTKLLSSQKNLCDSKSKTNIFITEKKSEISIIQDKKVAEIVFTQNKAVKPRKSCFQCAQCNQRLQLQNSVQLACTHRIHKQCMPLMNCRNKYTCKICQRLLRLKRITRFITKNKND